jgi:hypothetical protein
MRARRCRKLLIEGLAISHTATQELRPRRDCWQGILVVRQQTPERWMMPAELMTSAIAVTANTLAQLSYFSDQLVARHAVYVLVQGSRDVRGFA